MKDKYTGDVGDFGKYGMLNELCKQSKQSNFSIRLGVNWYYTTNDEYKNLFSWDDVHVPGKSNNKLRKILKNRYKIKFAETTKFEKIDNGKTIKVSTENNSISITLNNERTKVNLTIDDVKPDEFIAMMKNGGLKIYEKNRDGGHIEYLDNTNKNSKEFRDCFRDLYDNLQTIVNNGSRNINEIEKSRILPDNTIFYSNPLPLIEDRELWFKKSLEMLEDADIIFLDPDTGIQLDSKKNKQIDSIKYAFIDEIKEYYNMGKSLIIYNDRGRNKKSEYDKKIFSIRDYINPNGILVLRFKKVHVRDYIFLIQKKHQDLINETIKVLVRKHDFLFRYYDLKLQQVFQNVFGFPIPFTEQDLQPIEGKPFLFGSPIALQKQFLLQGFIDEFLESCPEGYILIGFWGHGLMSEGFYYSRVDSWSKIFFRLSYTGAYNTIEEIKEKVRCVREFLTQYVEFEKLISKRAKSLIAVESMGDGYYQIVMLNGKTYEIDRSLLDDCNLLKELSDLCEI